MLIRTVALLSVLALASAAPRKSISLRRLEEEDGDGDGDGDGEENEYAWMTGYNLMYENCFSGDNVAIFRLCPSGSTCEDGCQNGAEYVTDLGEFIDAFTEAQLGAREYRCEMARENCDYDDDATCYQASNLDYCGDANEDENGFDLQEYLECVEIGENGYYVGPYCADDSASIFLGVFEDEDCSEPADLEVFEDEMGFELPYSAESIIENECARCDEHALDEDKNGGDDEEDEDEVLEQCEQLYDGSDKCETELGIDDADESGCDYIHELQDSAGVGSRNASQITKRTRRRRAWGIIVLLILLAVAGYFIYKFLLKREKKEQAAAKGGVDADNKPSDEKLMT